MKSHKGLHDNSRAVQKADLSKGSWVTSLRGLAVMLGSCIAFMAFLVLVTIVIHFVML